MKQEDFADRSSGLTETESLLTAFCERTFFKLWSYSNVFRNDGGNKEVADVLICYGRHILILSDKCIKMGQHQDPCVSWGRWYRKAVIASVRQIMGAEKWIMKNPSQLYKDKKCNIPLDVKLPNPGEMKIHRVAVCSGLGIGDEESTMLKVSSGEFTEEHGEPLYLYSHHGGEFCHVFDLVSMCMLIKLLDTPEDFFRYLDHRESLFRSNKRILAKDERQIMAEYLSYLGEDNRHSFPPAMREPIFLKMSWHNFFSSGLLQSKWQADEVSYLWDNFLERTVFNALAGTIEKHAVPEGHNYEHIRAFAYPDRLARRMLCVKIQELLQHDVSKVASSVYLSELDSHRAYVLLVVSAQRISHSYKDRRLQMLWERMMAAIYQLNKVNSGQIEEVVGLALNHAQDEITSESFALLKVSDMQEEDWFVAASIYENSEFYKSRPMKTVRGKEYPAEE